MLLQVFWVVMPNGRVTDTLCFIFKGQASGSTITTKKKTNHPWTLRFKVPAKGQDPTTHCNKPEDPSPQLLLAYLLAVDINIQTYCLLLYLYRARNKITQLSIPTYAQLQRHRLKFIKNHLKNSYIFRSSTIFRERLSVRVLEYVLSGALQV